MNHYKVDVTITANMPPMAARTVRSFYVHKELLPKFITMLDGMGYKHTEQAIPVFNTLEDLEGPFAKFEASALAGGYPAVTNV